MRNDEFRETSATRASVEDGMHIGGVACAHSSDYVCALQFSDHLSLNSASACSAHCTAPLLARLAAADWRERQLPWRSSNRGYSRMPWLPL